jgi:hypothetical protein
VRLITVVGVGGVGKTRLAVAVASQTQSAFEDGARFVDLSAIRESALVMPTLRELDPPKICLVSPRKCLVAYASGVSQPTSSAMGPCLLSERDRSSAHLHGRGT